jgi:hypothetical protein
MSHSVAVVRAAVVSRATQGSGPLEVGVPGILRLGDRTLGA